MLSLYSVFFLNVFNIENYKEIYTYGDSAYTGPTYDMFYVGDRKERQRN